MTNTSSVQIFRRIVEILAQKCIAFIKHNVTFVKVTIVDAGMFDLAYIVGPSVIHIHYGLAIIVVFNEQFTGSDDVYYNVLTTRRIRYINYRLDCIGVICRHVLRKTNGVPQIHVSR